MVFFFSRRIGGVLEAFYFFGGVFLEAFFFGGVLFYLEAFYIGTSQDDRRQQR